MNTQFFMKRLLLLFFATCTIMLCSSPALAEGNLKYTIQVANFENRSNWQGSWNLGDAWDAVLTDSLNQTDEFLVVTTNDMRGSAMKEQDFASSDRAAGGGKKVTKGQMAPAQILIRGVITHFEEGTSGGDGGIGFKGFNIGGKTSSAEINAMMEMVDSSTGLVLASKKCYGDISKTGLSLGYDNTDFSGDLGGFKKSNAGKAIEKAIDEGIEFLIEQLDTLPWTGSVVLVKGKKIYINRGTREGVEKGQMFAVGAMEVLRDPDTGEILDNDMTKVADVKVIKAKEKISICKKISGDSIEKGMSVMLPEAMN